MSIVKEFKEFAVKGNAVEMAIGIVIGASFGKIVTSLVSDIMMPPLGILLGGVDFRSLKVVLKEGIINTPPIPSIPAVTLNYGMFINTVVDFLIVAFCIFLVVKGVNHLKKTANIK